MDCVSKPTTKILTTTLKETSPSILTSTLCNNKLSKSLLMERLLSGGNIVHTPSILQSTPPSNSIGSIQTFGQIKDEVNLNCVKLVQTPSVLHSPTCTPPFNSMDSIDFYGQIKDGINLTVLRPTTGDRPWVCDLCSFGFKYKNNLLEHLRFFHMKGSVPCNSCSQVFPTSRHLRIHRKHHSLEAGRCPHCRANFSPNVSTESYKEMYKKHLPECRRCPSSTAKLMNFTPCALKDTSDDHAIWRCLFCCSSFGELNEYQMHDCMGNNAVPAVNSDDSMENQSLISPSKIDMMEDTSSKEIMNIPSTVQLTFGITSNLSLNIDLNSCIICGVNFASDEQLSAHLYECHQTSEHTEIENGICQVNSCNGTENIVTESMSFCSYCKKVLPDGITMGDHEKECKAYLHAYLQTTEPDFPKIIPSSIVSLNNSNIAGLKNPDNNRDEFINSETNLAALNYLESNNTRGVESDFQPGNMGLNYSVPWNTDSNAVELDNAELRFNESNYVDLDNADPGDLDLVSANPNDVELDTANLVNVDFNSVDPGSIGLDNVEPGNISGEQKTIQSVDMELDHVEQDDPGNTKKHNTGLQFTEINCTEPDNHSAFLNSLVEVRFVCKYCKKDFLERLTMREHQKACKIKNKGKSNMKPNKIETGKFEVMSIFNRSDVLVQWLCKFCKKAFPEKSEMQAHKRQCTNRRESESISDSNYSDVAVRWKCSYCKQFFGDKTEMQFHERKCDFKPTSASNNTEVFCWVCKTCKITFANKIEAKVHKQQCNLQSKLLVPNKDAIIKWICKYCKKDFLLRENMLSHKKVCLYRNKDKNMLSSTESDMSEVLLQENNSKSVDALDPITTENNSKNIKDFHDGNLKSHAALEMHSSQNVSQNIEDFEEGNCRSNAALGTPTSQVKHLEVLGIGVPPLSEAKLKIYIPPIEVPPVDDSPMELSPPIEFLRVDISSVNLSNTNISVDPPTENPKIKLRLLKCNICLKSHTSRKQLKLHKMEMHTFQCSKCQRFFGSRLLLFKHNNNCTAIKNKRENKVKIKKYPCRKCFRIFRERSKYRLHKLSCKAMKRTQQIVNEETTIIGQNTVLKISCQKCQNEFIGIDIFDKHTCEKSTPVSVYLICKCSMHAFADIRTFHFHCLNCPESGYPMSTDNSSAMNPTVRLKCGICKRHFKSVVFYYYHILAEPSCRFIQEDHPLDNISEDEEIVIVDDLSYNSTEEISTWTCNRCKIDFPSRITKDSHDDICKRYFKDTKEEVNVSKSFSSSCPVCACTFLVPQDFKNHDCEERLKQMTSCGVVLEKLPNINLKTENVTHKCLELKSLESFAYSTGIGCTSVQKCVICHKSCRFRGVGLPPIGHLECFNCRRKTHKVNKKNPEYYSRTLVSDTISETDSNLKLLSSIKSKVYLSPSLRLKISRSKNKEKLSNGDNPHTSKSRVNLFDSIGIQSSNPPSRKCSHCKRGFSSEMQYQKHMQLSQTCFLAETSHVQIINNHIEQNGEINNCDFDPVRSLKEFNDIPNSIEKDQFVSSKLQEVSPFLAKSIPLVSSENGLLNLSNTNKESCISTLVSNEPVSYYLDRIQPNQSLPIAQFVVEVNQQKTVYRTEIEQSVPSQSYLAMEHVDKVLNSKPEVKRFPICSALQCDGWIIKSSESVNPTEVMNCKCICGGCYRSFSKVGLLREHMFEVHKRDPRIVPILKVMEHLHVT